MRRALAFLIAVGCGEAAAPAGEVAPGTVAERAAPEAVALDDAACARCHVEEARTWEVSAHHTAFIDEVFQAEWAAQEQAACVGCHAPLADPERPEGLAAASGVSCVVCHVRDGAVRSVNAAPDAPHPIRVDPSLRTVDACAGCHDFRFAAVAPTPYLEEGLLQGTLHEWHEVEERGTCQSCHMRDGERVSHAMGGGRDVALLTQALHVDASAVASGSGTGVTLVLRSEAGHAVPTGDMFRRLEVSAWIEDRPRERASTLLMRRFDTVDGALREVSDDRVPPRGERRVVLTLPRTGRVAWQITWQALDPSLARARWIPDEDVSRVVAQGVIEVD